MRTPHEYLPGDRVLVTYESLFRDSPGVVTKHLQYHGVHVIFDEPLRKDHPLNDWITSDGSIAFAAAYVKPDLSEEDL